MEPPETGSYSGISDKPFGYCESAHLLQHDKYGTPLVTMQADKSELYTSSVTREGCTQRGRRCCPPMDHSASEEMFTQCLVSKIQEALLEMTGRPPPAKIQGCPVAMEAEAARGLPSSTTNPPSVGSRDVTLIQLIEWQFLQESDEMRNNADCQGEGSSNDPASLTESTTEIDLTDWIEPQFLVP